MYVDARIKETVKRKLRGPDALERETECRVAVLMEMMVSDSGGGGSDAH